MNRIRSVLYVLALSAAVTSAASTDSATAAPQPSLVLLPDYYLRFDMSTFALYRDAFFKRQYLAEQHPDLEFCLLTYKNLIAWVWDVDFQVGLGEVPGNNVFTVLNIAFGYNPTLEVRLRDVWASLGLAHRCLHDVDRSDFPVAYWNRVCVTASSPNARLNTYWRTLATDRDFSRKNRLAWHAEAAYCVKELFGLVDPGKLDGYDPFVWEASGTCRYAFFKRKSWILGLRGETIIGNFSKANGYHVSSGTNWYWRETVGLECFFTRGVHGASLYVLYHLDDMPADPNGPSFTLGDSRFSKNGLLQIGVTFFN
jgi:hypothetical protein